MTDLQVIKGVVILIGTSQFYVVPAFLMAYFTLLQCKAIENPVINLANLTPWYVFVLTYIVISLAFILYQLIKEGE